MKSINTVSRQDFVKVINKLAGALKTYKSRIEYLEKKVQYLEQELNSPWKMPFDQ